MKNEHGTQRDRAVGCSAWLGVIGGTLEWMEARRAEMWVRGLGNE